MFNKAEFAKLITKAESAHSSLNKMAAACGISAAHLSRYKNQLKDTPPKPITLEKIAQSSGGKVSYDELMTAAGYIETSDKKEIIIGGANNKILDISSLSPEAQKQIFDLAETFKKIEDNKKG